jgi:hypothetical protein
MDFSSNASLRRRDFANKAVADELPVLLLWQCIN